MPSAVFVPAAAADLALSFHADVDAAAHGAVLYRDDDSRWHALAPGSAGQALLSGGAGADPTWGSAGVTDHGALTGLGDDDHLQYALLLGRAGGQTLIGGTGSGEPLTLQSTSHATRGTILLDGTPTSPGAGVSSEKFGASSAAAGNFSVAFGEFASAPGIAATAFGRAATAGSVTAQNCLAVGTSASATGDGSSALGKSALANAQNAHAYGNSAQATGISSLAFGRISTASGQSSMALGDAATASNTNATAIGSQAAAAGNGATAIGSNASAAGQTALALGRQSSAAHTAAIAIGRLATTTAVNQCVIGSATERVAEAYIGQGVTHTAPSQTIVTVTGGSGTNIAGANLILAGGRGTGNALGGDVIIQATIPGGSGTTLNALQEKFRFQCSGVQQFIQRSSTADRLAFDITPTLPVATDASRTARAVFNLTDFAATRAILQMDADGTKGIVTVPSGTDITSPGAGTSSERFGAGSLAAGLQSIAFGSLASGAGNQSVGLGFNAVATGGSSIAIGANASVTLFAGGSFAMGVNASVSGSASNTVAIGGGASATGADSVLIGGSTVSSAGGGIAIGRLATIGIAHTGSIAIGRGAASTAAGQLVIGGTDTITAAYIGKGVTNATPPAVSLNATGGSGTNIAGAALTLAGGKGTGSALGGSIKFQSTLAGGSGTTLNTLQDKWVMPPAGVLEGWQRSSTADRLAFDITPTLPVATDASRTARAVFNVTDFGATREALRLEANGTAAMLGVLGAAAVVRQAGASAAGIAAITDANAQAAIQALQTALANFGFVTSPA